MSREAGAESDHTKQLVELLLGRTRLPNLHNRLDARVVKLVDTQDLKSCAGNSVPVQVRPRAPFLFHFKDSHAVNKRESHTVCVFYRAHFCKLIMVR